MNKIEFLICFFMIVVMVSFMYLLKINMIYTQNAEINTLKNKLYFIELKLDYILPQSLYNQILMEEK